MYDEYDVITVILMEMAGRGAGQIHAIGAGLCAACASVFAKLAVTSNVVLEMCQSMLHLIAAGRQSTSESTHRRSSVQQNVWTDFCVPALSGWLLFGESLSLTWWCGAAFLVAGLLLINVDDRSLASSVKQD